MFSGGDFLYWESTKVDEQLKIERFYSFFEANYPSTFNFVGESHNFWECVYVISGELCVSADERVYNIKEGEIIIHKPLEFHQFHITSDIGAHLLVFSFSLDGELSDHLRNKIIKLSENEKNILNLLFDYAKNHRNPKSSDPNDFLDYNKNYPDYMQTVCSFVYILLLSFTHNKTVAKTITQYDSLVYEKAIIYMNENITRNVSTSEIASFCNVGATFLKLTFKKYSGISVHKFFINLKMRYALELLKNNHNVTEVSMQLGFCSQPYFSQSFKREIGISPSEVQKTKL